LLYPNTYLYNIAYDTCMVGSLHYDGFTSII
jgi:hypothetical protein